MKDKAIAIYDELQYAFDYYNKRLFNSELPSCLITLQRKNRSKGYFHPERFASMNKQNKSKYAHELAMNPEFFHMRPLREILSTLVHEMCHLYTFTNGTYGRGCYHGKTWARIMKSVGLVPTDSGQPGGRETGEQVTHYIQDGGPFDKQTEELLKKDFMLSWYDRYIQSEVSVEAANSGTVKIVSSGQDVTKYMVATAKQSGLDSVFIKGRVIEEENGVKVIERNIKKGSAQGVKRRYRCECSKVWGKPGLSMTCNNCGKQFREDR